MAIRIYEKNPSEKELDKAVAALEKGGVVIYPTDSVYAFGCSVREPRAVERMRRIKGKELTTLTLVCASFAQVAEYCRVDDEAFRVLRRNLPGPFTFLLEASSRVPDKAVARRRTIGIRIPDNAVARALVERLGCPMLTTSVKDDESESAYTTDPELIEERYGREADLMIDGGEGHTVPTTVVDLTGDDPAILREGRGRLE